MDGPRDYHTKCIKSEKDKYYMVSFTCGIKKKWYNWTYLQNRNSLTDIKNKLMVTKGEMRGRDKSEWWNEHTHTTIYKIDNQQGILYSTVNSIQYSVIPPQVMLSGKKWLTSKFCACPNHNKIFDSYITSKEQSLDSNPSLSISKAWIIFIIKISLKECKYFFMVSLICFFFFNFNFIGI